LILLDELVLEHRLDIVFQAGTLLGYQVHGLEEGEVVEEFVGLLVVYCILLAMEDVVFVTRLSDYAFTREDKGTKG